ncbi:hypothetical protein D8674_031397 [Pyrus ussuriensis x Pyrus communis]|uniref:Uncharacterized protein n=1 Tax=Pyrus ussuriensis x Pyrus communis TaxID=2448454 RepID=A0A5N5EYZ5_9ROSA|nr:hypothetical protein D8674_031397 [Pyrus ussuriensis x Pyrus communis]
MINCLPPVKTRGWNVDASCFTRKLWSESSRFASKEEAEEIGMSIRIRSNSRNQKNDKIGSSHVDVT